MYISIYIYISDHKCISYAYVKLHINILRGDGKREQLRMSWIARTGLWSQSYHSLLLWAKGDCKGIQQGVLQPLCRLDPWCHWKDPQDADCWGSVPPWCFLLLLMFLVWRRCEHTCSNFNADYCKANNARIGAFAYNLATKWGYNLPENPETGGNKELIECKTFYDIWWHVLPCFVVPNEFWGRI